MKPLSSQITQFYASIAPRVAVGQVTFHYADKDSITLPYSSIVQRAALIAEHSDMKYYSINPKV